MQRPTAKKMEQFRGEGLKMLVNLYCGRIYGVASKFPVLVLNGPEMSPSINGIIAEEVINVVNKKSACLNL